MYILSWEMTILCEHSVQCFSLFLAPSSTVLQWNSSYISIGGMWQSLLFALTLPWLAFLLLIGSQPLTTSYHFMHGVLHSLESRQSTCKIKNFLWKFTGSLTSQISKSKISRYFWLCLETCNHKLWLDLQNPSQMA